MTGDPASYRAEERLRSGQAVVIRAIRPDDRERIRAAFHGLAAESIYTRLFTCKNELSEADLDRLTAIDFESEVALVAVRDGAEGGIIIGSGRFFAFTAPEGRRRAEVAFLVEEDYQGQGVAGVILRHLAAIARDQGLAGFDAEVLPRNKAMLRVFARSGLPMERTSQGDVVQVRLSLDRPAG